MDIVQRDPRDGRYYRKLMTGLVKNVYHLLNFVKTKRGEGKPLNVESKLRHGDVLISPSILITSLKGDFDFLAQRLKDGDFIEDFLEEMNDILSVWNHWVHAENENSWLDPQLAFASSFEAYIAKWWKETRWTDAHETGLRSNATHLSMSNEPVTSLLCRLQRAYE